MTAGTNTTTDGVFSKSEVADSPTAALHRAGFSGSEFGVTNHNSEGHEAADGQSSNMDQTAKALIGGTAAGVAAGVGIGALIGALVLAGIVPVFGPALFAGTLGVLASNAAGAAAVVGPVGTLVGWAMSTEDIIYY